jgi:hypothetical protein
MPYAAITYRMKPGHEDEIAEVFSRFQRVDRPDFTDEDGNAAGKLLGTVVFLKDDVLVRVVHYEGDFAWVGRHMAKQKGVHLIEQELQPLLAERRDTESEKDFGAYFRNATMRVISELTVDTHATSQV